MRKAHLIKRYTEINNQGNAKLCEFHKDIEICDLPPIGYVITFPEPEDKTMGAIYIERAKMESKSGSLILYGSMDILNYENWGWDNCIKTILAMHKKGWKVKKLHGDLRDREELKELKG